MTDDLLACVLVPVASPGDATATADAVLPRVAAAGGRVVVLHVVETTGGGPDKAGVEQREAYADEVFGAFRTAVADAGVDVETRLAYGEDVVDEVFDAAADVDATAVAFTPRGGSLWTDLLTGDVTRRLVKGADRPVLVLPDDGDGGGGHADEMETDAASTGTAAGTGDADAGDADDVDGPRAGDGDRTVGGAANGTRDAESGGPRDGDTGGTGDG